VEDTFRARVKDTEQVEAAMVGRRQSKGLGVRVGARKGNRGGTEGLGRRSAGIVLKTSGMRRSRGAHEGGEEPSYRNQVDPSEGGTPVGCA
jgi:hypothetical protein